MLYIVVTRYADGSIIGANVATEQECRTLGSIESRWDWKSFEAAQEVAAALGLDYHATDAGNGVSPRYDVQRLPQVGDAVSCAFNGDSYPCGTITKISASKRVIQTSEGRTFYRVRKSGCWKHAGTWSLVQGHVYKQNPSF